jgi:hypothetical protein
MQFSQQIFFSFLLKLELGLGFRTNLNRTEHYVALRSGVSRLEARKSCVYGSATGRSHPLGFPFLGHVRPTSLRFILFRFLRTSIWRLAFSRMLLVSNRPDKELNYPLRLATLTGTTKAPSNPRPPCFFFFFFFFGPFTMCLEARGVITRITRMRITLAYLGTAMYVACCQSGLMAKHCALGLDPLGSFD